VGQNGSYRLFITNRFLRIYPTYWLILIATIVLAYIFSFAGLGSEPFGIRPPEPSNFWLYASPADIFQDVSIIGRLDYLQLNDDLHQHLAIGQAWTLVLELLFYVVAPFIVRKWRLLTALLVGSLLIRYLVIHHALTHNIPLTDRFFPSELGFFLLGSLAYFLYRRVRTRAIAPRLLTGITLSFVLFTLCYAYLPVDTRVRWMIFRDAYYVVSLALAIPFLFLWTKKSRIDRFIGELSYPVYLTHVTVLTLLLNSPVRHWAGSYIALTTIGVTVVVSLLIVQYFERPIEEARQRRLHQAAEEPARRYRDGKSQTAIGRKPKQNAKT
jgi:peptidoglycan/LPS O-acetylase OafA/YrhL